MEPRLQARKMVLDELRKQTKSARLGANHVKEDSAGYALLARLGKVKPKPKEAAEEEE